VAPWSRPRPRVAQPRRLASASASAASRLPRTCPEVTSSPSRSGAGARASARPRSSAGRWSVPSDRPPRRATGRLRPAPAQLEHARPVPHLATTGEGRPLTVPEIEATGPSTVRRRRSRCLRCWLRTSRGPTGPAAPWRCRAARRRAAHSRPACRSTRAGPSLAGARSSAGRRSDRAPTCSRSSEPAAVKSARGSSGACAIACYLEGVRHATLHLSRAERLSTGRRLQGPAQIAPLALEVEHRVGFAEADAAATVTVALVRGSHASTALISSVESCHVRRPARAAALGECGGYDRAVEAEGIAPRVDRDRAAGGRPGAASIQGEPSKSLTRSVPTARGSSSSDSRLPSNETLAGSASATVVPRRARLPRAAAAKRYVRSSGSRQCPFRAALSRAAAAPVA